MIIIGNCEAKILLDLQEKHTCDNCQNFESEAITTHIIAHNGGRRKETKNGSHEIG
jgi:hypothetical protein